MTSSEIVEGHDGLYALCVFFAENSSDDEVRDVFEEFGPVIDIHRVNNVTFVRYQHLDEAVNCYETMQRSDSKFKVKIAKKNKKSENGNQRRDEMYRGPNEGKDFRGGSRNDGGDFNNRNDSNYNRRNGGENLGNWGSEIKRFNPLPEMPKLVPKHPASTVEQVAGAAPNVAKEVIIGNIPHYTKQCYIYELCTKANGPPLHVEMKSACRPQLPILYYAHVYVRNDKDAKNITEGLNNLKINDRQLIACTVEKLTEEGEAMKKSDGKTIVPFNIGTMCRK